MESGISVTRLDLAADERFQTLRRELGVTTFGLNLIRLQTGQRGRIHRHAHQEEVFVVLEGILTLVVEGEERDVAEGEAVRIAPDVKRQLANRGPGRVSMLAIGGANQHAGRDGIAYESWDATEGRPPQEVPEPDDLPATELRS